MSERYTPNGSVHEPTGHIKEVRVYAEGRICKTRGCKTRLTMYRESAYCSLCERKRNGGGIVYG